MNAEHKPANPSRRRLAKGGLAAAPVVLATLSSKNAFALPYQCFTSGKLSNNQSAFGPNPTRDMNPTCALPSNTAAATSALNGTQITVNSTFSGVSVYSRALNGRLVAVPSSKNDTPATLYEVLVGQNATGANQVPVPNLDVLKKAIVIYFNAMNVTVPNDVQPLTKSQALQLINARISNQGASFSTSVGPLVLDSQGVTQYFNQFVV